MQRAQLTPWKHPYLEVANPYDTTRHKTTLFVAVIRTSWITLWRKTTASPNMNQCTKTQKAFPRP